jgi:hypothetical protein
MNLVYGCVQELANTTFKINDNDDYSYILVDRQGYFDRCVRLIVGVAFPSNMMVRTYGFLLPMAMSYVDLLVEANLDSGKKCFIE